MWALLLPIILEFGIEAVLQALVDNGYLPASVLGEQVDTAREHEPYIIEQMTEAASLNVADPRWGNHALLDAIHRAVIDINAHTDNALAGLVINLPDTPPAWWIPPTSGGDIATEVWNWELPNMHYQTYVPMQFMAIAAQELGLSVLPMAGDPRFGRSQNVVMGEGDMAFVYVPQPTPDWTAILPDDTRLSWLQRTDTSGLTWTADVVTGAPLAEVEDFTTGTRAYAMPLFTEDYFTSIAVPSTPPGYVGPPVWPGADLVTLGSPVAFTGSTEISGPMHGILLSITTPPTRTGLRDFAGRLMDYGVGELAFVNDDGEAEPWQYMGFREAIYTPKTMAIAGSVVFRVLGGAEGTVTPWTVNPSS